MPYHKFTRSGDIIKKYQQPLINKLKLIKKQRKLSALCGEKLKFITPPRLSELTAGTRSLSLYYLFQFLQAGFITIPELLEGKPLSDIPFEDRFLFSLLSIDCNTTEIIVKLKDENINIENILKLVLSAVEKGVDMEKLLEKAIAKES